MRKPISYLMISLAVLLLTATGCRKDKEDPVITILLPEEHATYTMGAELHVSADLTDDKELAYYKFFIGNETGDPSPDFPYTESGSISDKYYSVHAHTTIPDSLGMMHYIHFECVDAVGNTVTAKYMIHFEM